MKELHSISDLEQARTLLNETRVALLEQLRSPLSCAELARGMGMSAQRVNNHLKELLAAGLIQVVEERRKRHLIESVYQATAKVYWLPPRLTRDPQSPSKPSLHNLLLLAERLQEDASALLDRGDQKEVPSLGVLGQITLRSEAEGEAFVQDYLRSMRELVERYQAPGGAGQRYTTFLACYPKAQAAPSPDQEPAP